MLHLPKSFFFCKHVLVRPKALTITKKKQTNNKSNKNDINDPLRQRPSLPSLPSPVAFCGLSHGLALELQRAPKRKSPGTTKKTWLNLKMVVFSRFFPKFCSSFFPCEIGIFHVVLLEKEQRGWNLDGWFLDGVRGLSKIPTKTKGSHEEEHDNRGRKIRTGKEKTKKWNTKKTHETKYPEIRKQQNR